MQSFLRLGILISVTAIAGCAISLTPSDVDRDVVITDGSTIADVTTDVRPDAPAACPLPQGGTCAPGTSCPAGDGCNTCACPASGGVALCTQRDCAPVDVIEFDAGTPCRTAADCGQHQVCVFTDIGCDPGVTGTCHDDVPCTEQSIYCGCDGMTYISCLLEHPHSHLDACESPIQDAGTTPRPCRSVADCNRSEFCSFETPGCDVRGVCRGVNTCTEPVAPAYCGCDGITFGETSNCVEHPYIHTGPCNDPEGAACNGAAVGPGGGCLGPTDGPLPLECCFGYNCNARDAMCNTAPPPCAMGSAPSIAVNCWGECVPSSHCASQRCRRDSNCPPGWHCAQGMCVFNP